MGNVAATAQHPAGDTAALAAFFDGRSEYWHDIYQETGVQAEIYRARQAAVLQLVDRLDLPPGTPALDVGCGAGNLTVELARRGFAVEAVDASRRMVDLTRRAVAAQRPPGRVTVRHRSVYRLPHPPGRFALVVAVGVLPWLREPGAALAEIARVTREGGQVVLTADNRARLVATLDPWLNPGLSGLKTLLRRGAAAAGLWPPVPPTDAVLHDRRVVDALLTEAGLEPVERRTVGFGPFSLFRWQVLPAPAGIAVHRLLQRLADGGRAGIHWRGSHYVVGARRRRLDARS